MAASSDPGGVLWVVWCGGGGMQWQASLFSQTSEPKDDSVVYLSQADWLQAELEGLDLLI